MLALRSVAAESIREGRVRLNGKPVRDPDVWVDPENDRVTLDGRLLRPRDRLYMLLYKPRGYLCTREDPEGTATIYDLIIDVKSWMLMSAALTGIRADCDFTTIGSGGGPRLLGLLVKSSTRWTTRSCSACATDLRPRAGGIVGMRIPVCCDAQRLGAAHAGSGGIEGAKLVRTHMGPIFIGSLQIGQYRPLDADDMKNLKRWPKGRRANDADAPRRPRWPADVQPGGRRGVVIASLTR
ncbi:MAG: S4 domain-containing protein [Bryobacterales bacterium]|nr:S4 domain-containing protein [Bryobacterales bacterium]